MTSEQTRDALLTAKECIESHFEDGCSACRNALAAVCAALAAAEKGAWRPGIEEEIASLIAEHVTIAYEFAPPGEGLVDPDSIRVFSALAAASVVLHRLRPLASKPEA